MGVTDLVPTFVRLTGQAGVGFATHGSVGFQDGVDLR